MNFPILIQAGSAQHQRYRAIGYGGLALLLVALPWLLPEFQVSRLNRAIAMAVAILGLNLVVGFSGLLALCQSAFMAIGGFITASLIVDEGWDYWMTIPPAMLGAFVVGIILGVPALRIKGLYLAMATIAFAVTFPGLAKLDLAGISDRTGGANGKEINEEMLPPDWARSIGFDETEPAKYKYYPIIILAVLAFWAVANLIRSRPGRAIIAIRDNETGAAVSGVELRRFKVLNFGLSAALGGLAGCLWAMNSSFVAEQDFLFPLMVDLLVGLVVGGVATVSGAAVGAIVVVFGRWICQTYIDISLLAAVVLALIVVAGIFAARTQQTIQRKVGGFLAVTVPACLVAWLLFSQIEIPDLYRLDGGGPLSQAIFGIVLIIVVFFAPQGLIGAVREVRANFVRIIPRPPALPEGAESITPDIGAIEAMFDTSST